MLIHAVIVIFYMVIMFAVGLYASKKVGSTEDFLVAGRKLGLWVLVGTLCATQLGGGNIIGTSSNGYVDGISGAAFGVGTGIAMLVLGFFVAKPMRELGIITVSDYVFLRYKSNSARMLTALLSMVALVGILAAQVGALSGILSVFGINTTIASVVTVILIIIYTAASGMWGVALTDGIQVIFIFIGLPLTTFLGLSACGGWSGMVTLLEGMELSGGTTRYFDVLGIGIPAIIGLIFPMIAYEVIGQDFYQRMLSAKDKNIAKKAAIISGFILIVFGINSAIVGMVGRALLGGDIVPKSILANLAVQVLPGWAGGILIAALIAAIMSTADSLLLASTSHVINDLYVPLMKIDSSIDNKKLLKISKITTILIGVFALAVSLLIPQIITILIYSYTFYTSGVVVPVIVGMYWKKGNEYGALAAIIVGGATALLGIFKLLPIGSIPAAIVGIGISFITYIIVSLLTNKNEITEINEAM